MSRLCNFRCFGNFLKTRYTTVRWHSSISAARELKEGQKIHGYTVAKVADIPEFSMTGVYLHHNKTGAQHFHLARDDSNNAFSVMFRTTPMDDTGVPHILEHTVLCGSRKYPVKDPFFKMLNRSMSTFMNALTASDWTMYPFSTQNKQDYENLMSVYLDACFYPQLRELDFYQEGWRLEHENPEDSNSPLIFKGVVYNEMKGIFSSSDRLFDQATQNKLLPSHTYGVISGGNPPSITTLTWQQLKDFHRSHYHPSNAKFFTYGNFPLEDNLQMIDNNYLQHFEKISVDTTVPLEPRWTEPRSEEIGCPADPMAADPEKNVTIATSFLLSERTDSFETLTVKIIGELLVGDENSEFYESLIQTNLGSNFAPTTGFDNNLKENVFAVGLESVHPKDVETVKQAISDTIDKVIENGFAEQRIEAILHQIELSIKNQSANFGITLSISLSSVWNHDGDVIEALQVNKNIARFRDCLKNDPQFLQKKVKQYLKDNPHRLTLVMSPVETYEEDRNAEEKNRLQGMVDSLKEDDRHMVKERGLELINKQMTKEDIQCLPTLKISDLHEKIKPQKTRLVHEEGVTIQCSRVPTNEITYVRMISNIADLPEELKPYIPLFTTVITNMGAGDMDYKSLALKSALYTGGLSACNLVKSHHTLPNVHEQSIAFSSYCLDRNLDKMLTLWTEIFNRPNLKDKARLLTLINMISSNSTTSLNSSGHSFAMSHADSHLTPAAKLQETFDGISQVFFMKELATSVNSMEQSPIDELFEKLQQIANIVLNKNKLRIAVNSTTDQMRGAVKKVSGFLADLPGTPSQDYILTKDPHYIPKEIKTQFEFPFSVNYMSKSYLTVPYNHKHSPVLRVLSKLLWNKYLHREIREKGGAYGSGAVSSESTFSFFSYRDPNSTKTLEVFDNAIKWVSDNNFTDEDIDEAKLAIFQQLDYPITPGRHGVLLFESGITDRMRQSYRDKIFATSRQDLLNVNERYFFPENQTSSQSYLGPANENTTENSGWNVIKAES